MGVGVGGFLEAEFLGLVVHFGDKPVVADLFLLGLG